MTRTVIVITLLIASFISYSGISLGSEGKTTIVNAIVERNHQLQMIEE